MDKDLPPDSKKQKLDDSSGQKLHDVLDTGTCGKGTNSNSESQEGPVKEFDVGITEFISKHGGFQGIIKQRYSDFLVNEIGMDGGKVSLTDLNLPKCDEMKKQELSDLVSDSTLLSEKHMEQLKLLDSGKCDFIEVNVEVGEDKEKRTALHNAIRNQFPTLASRTEVLEGIKYVIASKAGPMKGGRSRNSDKGNKRPNRQDPWLHQGTDYCRCVLYKENIDTMFAVNLISRYLGTKPNVITYSGTKDKRAKTCQQLSFYRVAAAKLIALKEKLRDMYLGNFEYCKEPLALGDLKGNHFVIILRSVTGKEDEISTAMSSLKEYGFINYYGMQRFGTHAIPTHFVGRALLKGKWDEAVNLILKPRTGYDPIHDVRECWWTHKDAGRALKLIGKRSCAERHLLMGLKTKHSADFVGALGCIPRNNRLMYIHAYQSYIWNRMVSHRIREFGLKPIVGDLAISSDVILEVDEDSEKDDDIAKKPFIEPTVITEDNIVQYTIHDVVLPLPGYRVTLPNNKLAQLYKDWLAEDGLTLEALKNKVKVYSLGGTYRHILVHPENLSYEVMRYDDPHIPLVLSDYEKLKGDDVQSPPQDGALKALKLEFSLPTSTYATMAIREVLKQDTSAAHQTLLTAANSKTKSSADNKTKSSADNKSISDDPGQSKEEEGVNTTGADSMDIGAS